MIKVKLKNSKGFTLVEVLVAISVFVVGVVLLSYMILDASVSTRQGVERTQAVLLAREGIEASRSIRDNDFGELVAGLHGLSVSGGSWSFSGSSDSQDQFTRSVEVVDESEKVKKINSVVEWDFGPSRKGEVRIVTYLTDWLTISGGVVDVGGYCQSLSYVSGQCEKSEKQCTKGGGTYESGGDGFCAVPNDKACCTGPGAGPVDINEYCQSLNYTSGQCEKSEKQCTKGGGTYESGGDGFCSNPNSAGCCY